MPICLQWKTCYGMNIGSLLKVGRYQKEFALYLRTLSRILNSADVTFLLIVGLLQQKHALVGFASSLLTAGWREELQGSARGTEGKKRGSLEGNKWSPWWTWTQTRTSTLRLMWLAAGSAQLAAKARWSIRVCKSKQFSTLKRWGRVGLEEYGSTLLSASRHSLN